MDDYPIPGPRALDESRRRSSCRRQMEAAQRPAGGRAGGERYFSHGAPEPTARLMGQPVTLKVPPERFRQGGPLHA